MNLRSTILPIVLLFALSGCQPAVEVPDTEMDAVVARVARIEADLVPAMLVAGEDRAPAPLVERMAEYNVPGVSIAFFSGGEIAWTRTYGVADVDGQVPVSAETRFQAASISKPVAAMAALKLVQESELDLDAPVNDKLTSWSVPDNEFTERSPVTLRGLLTHTAGMTVHGFPGYGLGEEVPTAVDVLNGAGNTAPVVVDTEPRTAWRYAGGGYTVMQVLVSDVTGEAFPEVVAGLVLEPLEMQHSTYEQPLPEALRESAAIGYRSDGTPVDGNYHTYPEIAAAGLWTTPSDLARFAIAIQRAHQGQPHPVLSAAMIEQLLTPDLNNWGLGPAIQLDGTFFGHGGSNEGFRCTLAAQLDGDQGVAIMTNSDSGGALTEEILLTVAREYGWSGIEPVVKHVVELDEATYRAIEGVYRAEGAPGDVRLIFEDGRLWAIPDWQDERVELRPESKTEFFDTTDGRPHEFEWNESGQVVRFTTLGLVFDKIE